ncbi:MAG: thioredoxin domain-containing protein [Patescibacteria group bacterium]|nr:thioredoxin domain-containing protein [Patescibacteria group bacterium]MDE2116699.1 thioredoxin domain-containing protein [Patescibacteria group bacterium]
MNGPNQPVQRKQSMAVPVAIIIAGALVAFGLYWSGRAPASNGPAAASSQIGQTNSLDSIKSVQSTDHILGSPNAKVVIVEYSDTECPYCKQFHETLHQIVTDYNGQVAWVFRHFPLHQRSENEEEALECAAAQGGNDAFWNFTDQVFQQTNSNDSLDPSALQTIAQSMGLDMTKFNDCLSSGAYVNLINQEKQDAINAGAEGTPYTVIFAGGQKIPLTQGALPYEGMKNVIDVILKNV